MKTPMQELLKRVKEYRDSETDVIVKSRLNSVCVDIVGMLEKEKEVIINAVTQGWDYNEQGLVRWLGEKYYNETFKIKER